MPSAAAPNPGSQGALDLGCTCPVLDNNHGVSAPWPPDDWWFTEDCPVHRPKPLPKGGEECPPS